MSREKETYKYLEILKADTIKAGDERIKKNVSQENEKTTGNQTI